MLKQVVLLASVSVIVPLLIGLRNFRLYENDRKAITLFLLMSAVVEMVSYYLWMQRFNNLPVLHVYTIAEFLFLSYIYRIHIRSLVPAAVINTMALVYTGVALCCSLFIQSWFHFNSIARGIEILLIIFYAIAFIYMLTVRNHTGSLKAIPMFWFNTGVLVYYPISFFLFLLSNNMLISLSRTANQVSWAFHGGFLLVFHIFLSLALWVRPKQ